MRSGIRAFKNSILMSVTARLIGTLALLLCCHSVVCMAQRNASPSKTQTAIHGATDNESLGELIDADPGVVMIEGRHILNVYESIAGMSPQERGERIADRIIAVARDTNTPPEAVGTDVHGEWTEIRTQDKVLMVVTAGDATLATKTRAQLAAEDVASIRQALLNYRHDHAWNSILKAFSYTILITVLFIPALLLLRKALLSVRGRLERWVKTRAESEEKKTAWHIGFTYTTSLLIALATVFRWLLLIALLQGYLTLTMRFFPYTRSISLAVTGWLLSTLLAMARSGLEYLPNLLVIAVIVAIASQILKLISMIFGEIGKGNLAFKGFYPDWAEPTAKLVRVLALMLVGVIIFPYLPGAKSPALQGISIFVGVLLSLGSSSAVANGIAGIILTYMRSFLVGDWVKIGETIGEVVEKNILVTRILTPKQEIITIPNATVMNGSVMNYTRQAKIAGVIFHTTVTIGYDAPWNAVHQLLIDAANSTKDVLSCPEPFVLQTALNDFYVAYELNAYTAKPRNMQFIYSELHQNIQDKFNDAGVEICSPHFSALRDGNTIAIPRQYVAPDYASRGFRIDSDRLGKSQTSGHAAD